MELRAMHERNTLATAPLDKPKSVKITAANASKITDWLAAVNGKPTDHTLNDSETLFSLVSTAHNELLDLLGSTKAIVGACLTYRSGQAVSSAQKHVRKNTEIRIEFRAAGAYLTDVVASTVAHKLGEERTLILTEKQDALAIARQRTKYTTDNRQDQDKE